MKKATRAAPAAMMNNLDQIADAARAELETTNARRDEALAQSRIVVRMASDTIRAVHRHRWDGVEAKMAALREAAASLRESVAGHPELEHTGYTQDAMKEYAEAVLTLSLVRGDDDLPPPESIGVLPATYLNGLAEAASELRRHILDLLRRGDGVADGEIERLLAIMDNVYTVLFSFGFPDAISGGLRRRVDQLRGVLERTRGDVTTAMRQERLLTAMHAFEARFDLDDGGDA